MTLLDDAMNAHFDLTVALSDYTMDRSPDSRRAVVDAAKKIVLSVMRDVPEPITNPKEVA